MEQLQITSTDAQKVPVSIKPTYVDANGVTQPTPTTGLTVVWSILSGDATLSPSADGLSCDFISGATDSASVGQCVATASDGSSVTGQVTYVVTAVPPPPVQLITALNFTASAPVAK